MLSTVFSIACGAVLGALSRSLSLFYFRSFFSSSFLASTLPVNTLGCFLAGLFLPLAGYFPRFLWEGLLVGFLGAYTTFSSFGLEVLQAFEQGRVAFAFSHVLLSNACALLACFLGYSLSQAFFPSS